jgi:hypothetical protein
MPSTFQVLTIGTALLVLTLLASVGLFVLVRF